MSIRKKFLATVVTVAAVLCLYSMSAFAMGTDVKVANSNVNLRTGPGTGYTVITTIPSGTSLYVEQDLGDWLFVDYYAPSGMVQGYCYSPLVGATQPVYTTYAPYNNPGYYTTGTSGVGNYTVSSDVRLRAGPGTAYGIYTVIPGGATVYVYSVSNGWANVSYAGLNGYVSTSYINGMGGGSTGTTKAKGNIAYAGEQVLTSSDFTNMYSALGGGDVLTQLCAGSRLSVLDRSNGWYKVSYNGVNGWIPASALCKALGGACLTT